MFLDSQLCVPSCYYMLREFLHSITYMGMYVPPCYYMLEYVILLLLAQGCESLLAITCSGMCVHSWYRILRDVISLGITCSGMCVSPWY